MTLCIDEEQQRTGIVSECATIRPEPFPRSGKGF